MKAAGYIISGNFGIALIKNNPKAEPMRRSAKIPLWGILEFEKFQQVDTNLLL